MRRFLLPAVLVTIALAAGLQARELDLGSKPSPPASATPDAVVRTPLLSIRRTPNWTLEPTRDSLLALASADAIAQSENPSQCIVVERDETRVIESGVDLLLVPGATEILLTATAALDVMEANHTYQTQVTMSSDAVVTDGQLDGSIYLIGAGDPVLATPEYVARFGDDRVFTNINDLADQVVASLAEQQITTIDRVVTDESRYTVFGVNERDYLLATVPEFDGTRTAAWTNEIVDDNYVGPLSAMLINEGYEWDAERRYPDPPNQFANQRSSDPAEHAASVFNDLLVDRGITIRNSPINGSDVPALQNAVPLPGAGETLGSVTSPTLGEIVTDMISARQTTVAELLLKELGRRTSPSPFRLEASMGVVDRLTGLGYPLTVNGFTTQTNDGSGLSNTNRVGCDLLEAVIDDLPEDSPILAGLDDGRSGLDGCVSPPNTRAILGGFGTEEPSGLNDLTSLVGITEAATGDKITYAMISNAEGVGAGCSTLQQALLDAVGEFPIGPQVTDIAPDPALIDTES